MNLKKLFITMLCLIISWYNYKGKKSSRSEIKKDQIVNSDLVFTH